MAEQQDGLWTSPERQQAQWAEHRRLEELAAALRRKQAIPQTDPAHPPEHGLIPRAAPGMAPQPVVGGPADHLRARWRALKRRPASDGHDARPGRQ